jgi:hypothetical protein
MNLFFRIDGSLRRAAIESLSQRHEFAFERVGFFYCRAASVASGIMVLAEAYEPVSDRNYVEDATVGARINAEALRSALQVSLTKGVGIFHVHMHEHYGTPMPSRTDLFESKKFVPDFFNVTPSSPHGTLILSKDSAYGLCWLAKNESPQPFRRIEFVGSPFRILDVRA